MKDIKTINVKVKGIRPILFDRYPGDNKTQLQVMDKLYTSADDPKVVILPALNIISFLTAQNTESAPQRVIGRGWKAVAKSCLSFVDVGPQEIPFRRNGKPVKVGDDCIRVRKDKAIVKKGQLSIPQPKERPLIKEPWELEFQLTVFKNPEVDEHVLKKLFEVGGMTIGFGNYRGYFGKFVVEDWKVS